MSVKQYITVQGGQSIYNLGIQHYGSSEGATIFIADNPGLCDFETDPTPGSKLVYDPSKIIDQDVVNEFKVKEYTPASAVGKGGFSAGFTYGFNV